MGGTKKKSLASMEKTQDSQDAGGDQSQTSKGKKAKDQKSMPQQKKQLAFLPPKLGDSELLKSLTPLRAITVYGASKVLGVNASIAAGVLKDLESKSLLRKEGGFSGHIVWAVAQKS